MLMEKLQQERLMCCIIAVAIAERLLDVTIEFCRGKVDFGRPVLKLPLNRFKIVDMLTEVKLGRVFLDKMIADHMEGRSIVVDVSVGKAWATEMAMRVVDRCMDLHGPFGGCEENPMPDVAGYAGSYCGDQ
jgi:acyl-CoA dehydrogenase